MSVSVSNGEQAAKNNKEAEFRAIHPLAASIEKCIHKVRDIKFAALRFLPTAGEYQIQQVESLLERINQTERTLKEADAADQAAAIRDLNDYIFKLDRIQNSNLVQVIETGLFLSLFSAFDAFTGEVLVALYSKRPEVFQGINRGISFTELLGASSVESAMAMIISEEIEQFRRKSYTEQFEYLSTRFKIELTVFENWSAFVESSQRRNLLTHCDGIVSKQYIEKCKEAGLKEDALPKVSDRVELGPEYLFRTCELVIEVALKLGQTLWRKALPDELGDADDHLNSILYDTLQSGFWERAQMVGKYAVNLPRHSSDVRKRMHMINYAQSLRFAGNQKAVDGLLSSVDWSAADSDFKLAVAVLKGDFDSAAQLMRRIGVQGTWTNEHSYHIWPLFREFRTTVQFAEAYQEIYGYPYVSKLKEEVDKAQAEASAQVQQQQEENDENNASIKESDQKEFELVETIH